MTAVTETTRAFESFNTPQKSRPPSPTSGTSPLEGRCDVQEPPLSPRSQAIADAFKNNLLPPSEGRLVFQSLSPTPNPAIIVEDPPSTSKSTPLPDSSEFQDPILTPRYQALTEAIIDAFKNSTL